MTTKLYFAGCNGPQRNYSPTDQVKAYNKSPTFNMVNYATSRCHVTSTLVQVS